MESGEHPCRGARHCAARQHPNGAGNRGGHDAQQHAVTKAPRDDIHSERLIAALEHQLSERAIDGRDFPDAEDIGSQ